MHIGKVFPVKMPLTVTCDRFSWTFCNYFKRELALLVVFRMAKFFTWNCHQKWHSRDSTVLPLATLIDMTQVEVKLFMLCHPKWPR